ncbi:RNA dependent RNA polymerase-domain-containing protein [Armillaria novae-zelandiae]|uniref:RNA-dependent RNA polymerase n=1 Tax=Armillaria novae-zelandiae TaxID=153914 RepID=A0AA39NMR8_9AGAR|nr:RNA dependent RNA polymerase-domain-containing protein [Armillaria novae-zelandiae]
MHFYPDRVDAIAEERGTTVPDLLEHYTSDNTNAVTTYVAPNDVVVAYNPQFPAFQGTTAFNYPPPSPSTPSTPTAEDHVTMVWVNEAFVAGEIERPLHGLKSFGVGCSLFNFVNLLNPLEENRNQFLGKWASRMALYLSVSVPGPRFREEDIHEQDDHFSAEKSNMTDGCGISNLPLHLKSTRQNNRMPTAVQFRLREAKGMLLLMRNGEWLDKPRSSGPPSTEERPEVWFRRLSQIKINYPATKSLDPLHLTMAILHFSSIQSPARLSAEVIINLEHNGVPAVVFEQLGRNCIQQDVEGIYSARRMHVTENRKRPLRRKKDDEDDHDAGAWFSDPHSGCPTSLGEMAMELLDSGFLPDQCNYLKQRLWRVAKTKMHAVSSQFNFELEQSCSGLVVIDLYGVLEENEIQVKSSRHEFKTDDRFEADTVLGEVVIARNPCKIPTDSRKVTAVTHPKLADMTNVIVCSIKGGTALLQYLAGGDYDGDRILVIWARAIVDTFRNAHEDYMKLPPGFEDLFERDTKTVDDFYSYFSFTDFSDSDSEMTDNSQVSTTTSADTDTDMTSMDEGMLSPPDESNPFLDNSPRRRDDEDPDEASTMATYIGGIKQSDDVLDQTQVFMRQCRKTTDEFLWWTSGLPLSVMNLRERTIKPKGYVSTGGGPVPRIRHPDWLHRRVAIAGDNFKQTKLTDFFRPAAEGESEPPLHHDIEDMEGEETQRNRIRIAVVKRKL